MPIPFLVGMGPPMGMPGPRPEMQSDRMDGTSGGGGAGGAGSGGGGGPMRGRYGAIIPPGAPGSGSGGGNAVPPRGSQVHASNDYCQHFVDTGQRPQNFLRDSVDIDERQDELLTALTILLKYKYPEDTVWPGAHSLGHGLCTLLNKI